MKKNKIAALLRGIGRAVAPWSARGRVFELDQVSAPRSPRGGLAMPVLSDGGWSNIARTHIFGGLLGHAYAPLWHTFFNDFDGMADFNGIVDTNTWDITNTGAGTIALTDGDSGLLLITNAAADDDRVFAQKKGESFKYEAGKPLLFSARFKVSDATQSDFVMGLQITDNTPLAVSDGIWFQKDDGDAFLDFHVAKGSAQTDATAIATVVADTFLTVQFAYDGEKGIDYGVNGVKLGSTVLTNAPDTEELTVSFGIQNGEAVAKTMTVDFVMASKYTGRS